MADSNSDIPAHLAQLQKAGEGRGLEVILRSVARRDGVIAAIRDGKAAGVQAIKFLATPIFSVNSDAFIAEVTNLRLASARRCRSRGHVELRPANHGNVSHARRYRGQGVARHGTRRYSDSSTQTIPIVFLIGGDPVKMDLVASMNRPGGNVTGLTLLSTEIERKRLALLQELIPKTKLIAVLINPYFPATEDRRRDVLMPASLLASADEVIE